MTKLYELQFFLGYDFSELMGRMFMVGRIKINEHKFNNILKILVYHYILIISPNMACEVLIEKFLKRSQKVEKIIKNN